MAIFWLFTALSLALFSGQALSANNLAPIPKFDYVADSASLFTPEQRKALWNKIAAFEKKTGSQVAVVVVPSLNGEPIEAYAHRVGVEWKPGRKGIGDGLLIFIAPKEGQVRIDVMQALEGAIPDVLAYRILEEDIIPSFKKGNFYEGVNKGLDSIFKLIEGENLPRPKVVESFKNVDAEEEGIMYLELAIVAIFMGLGIIMTMQRLLGNKGTPISAILTALVGWVIFGSFIAAIIMGLLTLAFCLFVPNRVLEASARRASQLNRLQGFGRTSQRNPFGSFGSLGSLGSFGKLGGLGGLGGFGRKGSSRGVFRGPSSGSGGRSAGGGASGRW
ncbi:MAG: TPM domain-containing protein [Burkholderiales bacterium]|nr:TPM domain-containing protein [Burkholderiales bacterium]